MKKLFLFILIFGFINVKASVDITPNSKSSILIENSTNKVLYEKESHVKRSPASMTKIMTLLLTMEALESDKIKLDDKVFISKNAASMGGTQIFASENTYVSVQNLIKGIGIASANDASVAIAEYIGGTEENFVNLMNERARSLGCKNTNFKNSHGLDEENHYTTAYDLSLIASALVKYQYAIQITSTYEDYIDVSGENHWLVNTNKLVRFYNGIDGLKTGYTDNAKYCLTATINKNNMRLISIVMGVESKDNRSNDTISLIEYGYSMYGSENVISKDKFEETMIIDNAKNRKVKYYLDNDVNIIVTKGTKDVKYNIKKELYDVKAPLKKGSKVGELKLNYDNKTYKYDLIVKSDVEKSSYFNIFINFFKDVTSGIRIKNYL